MEQQQQLERRALLNAGGAASADDAGMQQMTARSSRHTTLTVQPALTQRGDDGSGSSSSSMHMRTFIRRCCSGPRLFLWLCASILLLLHVLIAAPALIAAPVLRMLGLSHLVSTPAASAVAASSSSAGCTPRPGPFMPGAAGDPCDREGLSPLFLPPHPFQRRSIVPLRIIGREMHQIEFSIQARDITGERVRHGGDLWSVRVEGADPRTESVRWRMYPEDRGDGSYMVRSPLPGIPGSYVIRTQLVAVQETRERCDWDLSTTFCRFNHGCKKREEQEFKPDWLGWTAEEVTGPNATTNNLVLLGREKDLVTELRILAEGEEITESELAAYAQQPSLAQQLHSWSPIIAPFRSRPVCPDTRDRRGYNVGAWFFPFECNYRFDRPFARRCTQRVLKGQRVLLLGSSLELRVREMVYQRKDEMAGLAQVVHGYGCCDAENIFSALRAAFAEGHDNILFEFTLHDARGGCKRFQEVILPSIEHAVDDAFFRPSPSLAHLVNKSNPLYDPLRPSLPPAQPTTKKVFVMTGSYVQWNSLPTDSASRYATLLTHSARVQRLNDMMSSWADSKGGFIKVIGRFEPLAALARDTKDNVHYNHEADVLQWRIILNALCAEEAQRFEEDESIRYDTSLYEPYPLRGIAGH